MLIRTITCLWVCLAALWQLSAQPCTGRTIADIDVSRQYIFRAYYDNDFLTGTNRYYTQGIRLEFINPQLRKFWPAQNLLYRIGERAKTYYGLGVQHRLYTPADLQSADVVTGDRPYAGYFTLNTFLISNDLDRMLRLTTQIEVGLLGPLAGGGLIVRRTEKPDSPQGWSNQIKTDLILGYQAVLEKGFLSTDGIDLAGQVSASVSTRYTYLGVGGLLRLGLLNPYFYELHFTTRSILGQRDIRDMQVYVYVRPEAQLVAYDATLQGGLLNRSSPYTIPASDLKRVRTQLEAGLEVIVKRVGLGAAFYWQGSQFDGAESHKWGQLKLFVLL
ncbi:MAG: lipid A deacylase LpxR family protein [Bacteroidetes bacterium]|nr:MAG: lipid A deacylase LpxR family protein [Bacteroidota bacterium]